MQEKQITRKEGGYFYGRGGVYTGIGRNTMRKLVEWEKIPVLRIGRKAIIRRDVLERFMAANEGQDLRNRPEVKTVRT